MMAGGEMRVSIDRANHQVIQELAQQWYGGSSTSDFSKAVNQIIFLYRLGHGDGRNAIESTPKSEIDELAGLLD